MNTNQSWLAMLAAVAALASTQTAGAQSRYTITDLGTLSGLDNTYVWGGVNSLGHVAGYATNSADPDLFSNASAYLWTGEMQLLAGLPPATTTIAFGLNDLDQVVGATGPTPTQQSPQGQYIGMLWEGGSASMLNQLPGDTDSEAYGINNSGLVVGRSFDFSVDPWTGAAVYWNKGKVVPLPPLDGASNSAAIAVSEWGQMIGYSGSRAVLWGTSPKAGVIDLGTLGGDGSSANDINECGQIVGQAQTVFGDWLPVLWNGMDITVLQIPDQDQSGSAFWINNSGQIVGCSGAEGLSGSDTHKMTALLWEAGRMIRLQDQIPANSGWKLRQATGINDQGQITGFGQHNGKMRAFLLTPTVTGSANLNAFTVAAMAAKKPVPYESLWPAGAKVVASYHYTASLFAHLIEFKWPLASNADHYRVTIVESNNGSSRVVWDQSPASYRVEADGWALNIFGATPGRSYKITVTAYSELDEAGHSESLTAIQNVPISARKQ